MSDPVNYLDNPCNPRQDPRRRWLRCHYLLERRQPPSPTLDDQMTKEAWAFLCDVSLCVDDADRQAVARRFPAVADAHRFFTSAEPIRRAELEARLLADEDDATIAAKCGLSPVAVAAYHDLFFTVRHCLDAVFYIVGVVLGPRVHTDLTPDDHERWLKVFGYGFGGIGVDHLLEYFANPPVVPDSLEQLDLPALRQLRTGLAIKQLILETTTPAAASLMSRLRLAEPPIPARAADRGQPAEEAASVFGPVQTVLDAVTFLSQAVAA
jgi:hypothetical protein